MPTWKVEKIVKHQTRTFSSIKEKKKKKKKTYKLKPYFKLHVED